MSEPTIPTGTTRPDGVIVFDRHPTCCPEVKVNGAIRPVARVQNQTLVAGVQRYYITLLDTPEREYVVEPPDPTPEQLRKAMAELQRPPTFADLLDRHRPLAQAIRDYTSAVYGHFRQDVIDAARARLNAEAERAGISW